MGFGHQRIRMKLNPTQVTPCPRPLSVAPETFGAAAKGAFRIPLFHPPSMSPHLVPGLAAEALIMAMQKPLGPIRLLMAIAVNDLHLSQTCFRERLPGGEAIDLTTASPPIIRSATHMETLLRQRASSIT